MSLTDKQRYPAKGKPFTGVYRITGRVAHFDEQGEPYVRLRLSNSQADHLALVWLNQVEIPEAMGYLSLVQAYGVRFGGKSPWVMIEHIQLANRHALAPMPILHSLPRCYCLQPQALDELVLAVNKLQSEPLKIFIRQVLERRDRVEPFLRAPASGRYHHSYPGGLLIHSLEVANSVRGMIELNEPEMPQQHKEIGYIAGLLHDIGKIRSFDATGVRHPQSLLIEHDALTLELCAPGLAWLDHNYPDTAMIFRHLWTCASPGARYGQQPMMTLARYLRDADGQSAMADNQRMAFRYKPTTGGFRTLGRNRYWQPKPETKQATLARISDRMTDRNEDHKHHSTINLAKP